MNPKKRVPPSLILVAGFLLSCGAARAVTPLVYGYVSTFPSQSSSASAAEIAWLQQYHVNAVQFYDWQYKHHVPLAGTVSSPAASWLDFSNRTNYRQTVLDMIGACHGDGMATYAYNLLYGADGDYTTDGSGVSPTWGLYTDTGHASQYADSGFPPSWAAGSGVIDVFDPSNTSWQNYLFGQENNLFAAYPFDGWQVDSLGDPGQTVYNYSGQSVSVWATFVGFMNNARSATGKQIIFNDVGGYGLFGVCNQTGDAASYVECWPYNGQATYDDLKTTIDDCVSWSNGTKPVVLAAYMDTNVASGGTFSPPGVLLTDATIFASGGTHLELGDGGQMLHNVFFPDHSVTLSSSLASTLQSYYNFLWNYQTFLYGGYANSSNVISLSVPSSSNGSANTVWAFPKVLNNSHVLNFINLMGESNTAWQDASGTYPAPAAQSNVAVKYYFGGGAVTAVNCQSPDTDGASHALSFLNGSDSGGSYVAFTLPRLAYWDMVTLTVSSAPVGRCIAIYSGAAGKYVSNNLNNGALLQASFANSVGTWETFDVVSVGGSNIALRSIANNDYVSNNLNNGDLLQAGFANSVGTWETYSWSGLGGNSFALRSIANNDYVSCDLNDSDLLQAGFANSVGTWETYSWSDEGPAK